ncbi:MAG TPA: indole-3-glycerol phosphate synthase TrpC [Chloroflexota bacterium]|nr:indole-3-glycerol phosphate synthase TrpC [Chloroflexota bacterium]
MILDEIVAHKRDEVAARRAARPLDEVHAAAEAADPARPFKIGDGMSLIAEVKRRSPSAGRFVAELDPVAQAQRYERGGASAISVLADDRYFGGSLADLLTVRAAVSLPVLCKDFILTPYQVYEARAHGADLLLLIACVLSDEELHDLADLAIRLGMTPLVEVHDQHDLARAIAAGAGLIGINNRDLTDFSVDLLTTEYLAPLVPDDAIAVSESGIATHEDVERARRAGARAVLVGETLMRSADPAATIQGLLA